jgi:hypothetical protein
MSLMSVYIKLLTLIASVDLPKVCLWLEILEKKYLYELKR